MLSDEKELRHRLNELQESIVTEFGLKPLSHTRWEIIRDDFIEKVRGGQEKQAELMPRGPRTPAMGYAPGKL